MIEHASGNLLDADAQALVNTVNCVGVMGKGIALQFKQAFPENFTEYERACRHSEVQFGRMFIHATGRITNPRYIINFPTKGHWKERSRIQNVQAGLRDLVAQVRSLNITSIAVPPLGCGNGGLDWADVAPLIEAAFSALPEVRVLVFRPSGAPQAEKMQVGTKAPEWTRARALFIELMRRYALPGYNLTLLEIQKLAFFLQEAGEPLKLNFARQKRGPYAENLNFVLQRLEGHFIRGYGDRSSEAEIHLLPGADTSAQAVLAKDADAQAKLERVSRLIEGFETPYGMELLATVCWVAKEDAQARDDISWAVAKVQDWSPRKKRLFTPAHIIKSWNRLRDQGWINSIARQ